MSGVEPWLVLLPLPPLMEKVSVPAPPYEEHVEKRGDDFRNGRGDADVELVVVAKLDGELVLAVAALRVREASARASGRARADEATTDGDPGWTRETLTWRRFLSPFTAMTSSPPPPYALC